MTESKAAPTKPIRDRRFPAVFMDNFIRRLIFPPEKLVSSFVSEGKVVADLGCGPGYFTLPIAKIVGQTGKVYAVDFDAKQIERVKKNASRKGYTGIIDAYASSASEIDFIPDKGVDFVFASGLLCCMLDHAGAIREIKRVLNEDGSAYLSVSKLMRKSDPRAITKSEWRKLISENFKVVGEGERLVSRWAHVAIAEGDGSDGTETVQREKSTHPRVSACCSP